MLASRQRMRVAFAASHPVKLSATTCTQPLRSHPICAADPAHRSPPPPPPPPPQQPTSVSLQSRRAFLATAASIAVSSVLPLRHPARAEAASVKTSDTPLSPMTDAGGVGTIGDDTTSAAVQQILGRRTPSGITFIEFEEGSGPTPKWGDYVNIDFTLYTLAPSMTDLVQHESSANIDKNGYLFHHGNGEHILGLEEMVHSMRPGSKRRCIIPGPMAYTHNGLAPIPLSHISRKKFSKALNAAGTGVIVMDLALNWSKDDIDDRGYYSDLVPSDDELMELMQKNKETDLKPGVKVVEI